MITIDRRRGHRATDVSRRFERHTSCGPATRPRVIFLAHKKLRERSCCCGALRIGCVRSGGARATRGNARLSDAFRHHGVALRGGRGRRSAGARGGAEADRTARQILRGRKSPGRRRRDRGGLGGARRARRLHAVHGHQHAARDPGHAAQVAALRSGRRLRAGGVGRQRSVRADGQSVVAGPFGDRSHQARQAEARSAVLRIERRRRSAASLYRVAGDHDRHPDDAYPVQGHRRGDHRRGRRQRAGDLLRYRAGGRAAQGRQAARARHILSDAVSSLARRAAAGGSRRGRLQCGSLDDAGGARQDSA